MDAPSLLIESPFIPVQNHDKLIVYNSPSKSSDECESMYSHESHGVQDAAPHTNSDTKDLQLRIQGETNPQIQ